MAGDDLSFKVNGKPVEVEAVVLGRTLLWYLRERLDLTGAKQSCDNEGACGSCTVIVGSKKAQACRLRLAEMHGKAVETIEGLSADGGLHPLQKAFVLNHVMQCGYATPGQIMSCVALLAENPDPSAEQIAEALRGNISRCSAGYRAIAAVQQAAAALRGETALEWDERIAARERRAISKATGALRFTDDLKIPDLLHGKVKRSDSPHAGLERIEVARAEAMPGVVAVLTAKDIPGENRYGLLQPDQPVFCDRVVRMIGDAIAMVVAETSEQAEAALERIEVSYAPLPLLTDPRQALKPDAVQLHAPREEGSNGNVLRRVKIRKGDIVVGFAEADVVVEGQYYTPFQEHGYEELECSVGMPEGDGVVVYCGSQGPTDDRRQIASALGIPEEDVRVANMPVGGAFGGKEDVSAQVLAAVAAYVLGRPVKVRFSRHESLRAHHKRHAQYMRYRTGAKRDGTIVALEAELIGDTGAYASTGEAVLFRSATFAGGPYEIPHAKVDSYAVHTNNITCGAFRGFGSPQPTFAAELQMEKLARALGMDSFAFRIKNALSLGRMTLTGHVLDEETGDGIKPCLEAVRQAIARASRPSLDADEKLGIGVAGSYKNVGLGGGIPDGAGAAVRLQQDGSFLLRAGAADLGQGSSEALLNIAAETLGIDRGLIHLHVGDTRHDPHGGMTTASRVTFVSGNAVLLASQALLQQIREAVASEFQIDQDLIALRDRSVVRTDTDQEVIRLERLARGGERFEAQAQYEAPATNPVPEWASPAPTPEESELKLHFAYSFGAQAAMVSVNQRTGQVRVHYVAAANDLGRAIHRPGAQGQIEGGVIQGMGFALSERFHLREGRLGVSTYAQLGLPQTPDLPRIEAILVEEPHPMGPYGAKGMGELPLTATAPAIVNAIYDAVGVWIPALPVTPEKVLAALKEKESAGGSS